MHNGDQAVDALLLNGLHVCTDLPWCNNGPWQGTAEGWFLLAGPAFCEPKSVRTALLHSPPCVPGRWTPAGCPCLVSADT